MARKGFDNGKYLEEQSKAILDRIGKLEGTLYLEFGGKLLFDYHAARVLPGYDPNIKIELLKRLQKDTDIILCIYADDIAKGRIRGDFGITYDVDALKLIDDLRGHGLEVSAVVITRFEDQSQATGFKQKLENRGIRVYLHRATKGYPTDVETIVSEEGYGKNPHIETEKHIVVVTGPGPGSGKLATCLSQLYHDYRRGVKSTYAKFETFPIWNIPLKHPVNMAYEAATADLGDFNLIDPFHLNAHGETTVNYNRDVEVFPVIKRILERIMGKDLVYQSPTDMGVNRAGFAIVDDEAVRDAAKQEIIRRYFRYRYEHLMGIETTATVERAELLMEEVDGRPEDRPVVEPARAAAAAPRAGDDAPEVPCGAAMELPDGVIVTGKNSRLMSATSAVVLNAVKHLAEIPDKLHLLPPQILENITKLKADILGLRQEILDLDETLIALSMSAAANPTAALAMEKLKELAGCEAHLTHIPAPGDDIGLRRLQVNLTTDGDFPSQQLFMT